MRKDIDWIPEEKAPKDGTFQWALWNGGTSISIVSWNISREPEASLGVSKKSCWEDTSGEWCDSPDFCAAFEEINLPNGFEW